jgi:uncharacterized alkaline shock family protein YloU
MDQQLPEYVIAEALVRATRAMPGIADVYGGPLGSIATYGRGSRVPGVRVRSEAGRLFVEMHVVAVYNPGQALPALAERVRAGLREQLQALAVTDIGAIDVVVDDIRMEASR